MMQTLIERNIKDEFYEGIEKSMISRGSRRFQKPTVAELITYRMNMPLMLKDRAWVIEDIDKNQTNALITELYINMQLEDKFDFKEYLFESSLIAHFDGKDDIYATSILDPAFYIISLGNVYIRNKEFNNMLMHMLKSRAYYNYPTLIVFDKGEKTCVKDGQTYYNIEEIKKLGYIEVTQLVNLAKKRNKMSGSSLNDIIMGEINKNNGK